MKIILAEAAMDENGQVGYEGSKPGDQTGNEVRNIAYYEYRKGWAHVYRWKDRKLAERFAIRMQGAVVNSCVGYSQPKRYTYWDQLKVSAYDPAKIIKTCECDCSSLVCANVNAALLEAGIKTNISPMESTSSMAKVFGADKNFTDVVSQINLKTGEGLMVGDILLSPPAGHTAAVYQTDKSYSTVPKWVGRAIKYCDILKTPGGSLFNEWPHLGTGNLVDVCDEEGSYYYIRIAGIHFAWTNKSNLVNNTSVQQKKGQTITQLYMRTGAGTGNPAVAVLPTGAKVTITGQATDANKTVWYQIQYGELKGYASSKYIKVL